MNIWNVLSSLILAAFMAAAADMTLTVDQLVSFIKSSVEKRFPDKQVADYLRHVRLSNKLEDRTIEELQGMGAGPKTVAALHDLRDGTAGLAPPPPPAPKPTYKPLDPPD